MRTDPESRYIQKVLDTLGLTKSALARRSGLSTTTLTRALNPEYSGRFNPRTIEAIEEASGIPFRRSDFVDATDSPGAQHSGSEHNQKVNEQLETMPLTKLPLVATGVRDFPIYAAARGGPGEMVLSSDPIEYIERPTPVAGTAGSFGVYVTGSSMEPRFEPGDIALVHPRSPRIGDDIVLVRASEGGERHAMIKRLVGYSNGNYIVRQFNPAKDFEVSAQDWPEIHTVVGRWR